MIEKIKQKIKTIPGMDILLEQEWAKPYQAELGRDTVKRVFNDELTKLRRLILSGEDVDVSLGSLRLRLEELLEDQGKSRLRPMLNATGVVIHTNLGRSRLAKQALKAVTDIASNYSNLEYNLKEGQRGHRNEHIEPSLCAVTGAEAALVVNNNAGAVLLCLSALSRGSEVIVSRGELVEIGGSFRIPDIMEFSGAKLIEAGTTNRTHLKDYARAITENTSMLLKVHPSNFRITGFTTAPSRADLAALAHERGLIFMEDAGSGLLAESSELGLGGEASVMESLKDGVDIITFSGDKMLGGPQIGVIAGKRTIVDRLRGHPVLRALRVDKMTLAAFEATIRLYMKKSYDEIPTLAMLRRSDESMKAQAARLAAKLRRAVGGVTVAVIRVDDAVGGGSYPEQPLHGWGVAVSGHPLGSAGRLAELLRSRDVPIICGARDEALVLHVRTLRAEDEREVVRAFGEMRNRRG
ncbi:L-seryl-tRNA(Sec) selenium transferase [Synergistales bacterium]|nr:L-seryl-tRNA(Sec) selenium transferase [Synergistales bacterium]